MMRDDDNDGQMIFGDLGGLKIPDILGGSPGEVSEELVPQEKRKKGWRMNCDVAEARRL